MKERKVGEASGESYPMQDEVPMTKLQAAECHRDPTLDVSRQEDQRAVFDDQFQICVEKL